MPVATTEIFAAVWPAIAFETSINWNVDPLPSEINISGGAKLTAGALPEPVPESLTTT